MLAHASTPAESSAAATVGSPSGFTDVPTETAADQVGDAADSIVAGRMWERWAAVEAALAGVDRASASILGGETLAHRPMFGDLLDVDRLAPSNAAARPRRPIVQAAL